MTDGGIYDGPDDTLLRGSGRIADQRARMTDEQNPVEQIKALAERLNKWRVATEDVPLPQNIAGACADELERIIPVLEARILALEVNLSSVMKREQAAVEAERQRVIDKCVGALWERVQHEEYGHAKAAVTLDIEALESLDFGPYDALEKALAEARKQGRLEELRDLTASEAWHHDVMRELATHVGLRKAELERSNASS